MARSHWSIAAISIVAITVAGVTPAYGQSPSASPIGAAGSPAASIGASASPSSSGVTSITDGPGFRNSFAYGVATAPDGSVVMVGQHLDKDPAVPPVPAGAAAWHSVDGTTWTEVPLPQSTNALALNVAVSVRGWAAVGFVPKGAGLVWTSTDGRSWVSATPFKKDQPQTVIATTNGFLVGGQSVVKRVAHPVLWQSTDLVTWARVKLPGKGIVTQLAQGSSGVILAVVASVASGQVHVRYLRSVDGSTWARVDVPASRTDKDFRGASELGTSGDLFIQAVNQGPIGGPYVGSIWTSPDGLVWQDAWTAPVSLFAVASGPVVSVFGRGIQGASADGVTWTETFRPEIVLTSGATNLPDGRSIVLDNSNGTPPSIVVQLVPATVEPTPSASPAVAPSAPASPLASPLAPASSAPRPSTPTGSAAP